MEFSKDYFDQQFSKFEKNFISKDYFDKQNKLTREHLDNKFGKFEKRLDEKLDAKLAAQTKEITQDLKAYVHESFETQQDYLDERFTELVNGMRVKVDFPALKN